MIKLPFTLPALNWPVLAIKVLLAVAVGVGIHYHAKHQCELEHEKQKTEQAEQKTREIIKEVEVRVPEVQKIEVESAKQRQEIARLKERLDEAIKNRPEDPSCALSESELAGVRELAKQTHRK